MKMNNPTAWGVSKNFGAEILKILSKQYNVRTSVKGTRNASVVEADNAYYMINDNGGEFNIEKLNAGYVGSVPYRNYGVPISAATAAYRIAETLKGKSITEIDWDKEL